MRRDSTPQADGKLFGENLKLKTIRCEVCGRWFALRVDQDDLDRHYAGRVRYKTRSCVATARLI
jgi:hypothetical protein